MRLVKMKSGWMFVGNIPTQLVNKSYPDRYGAIETAERLGYVCLASGEVVEDKSTTDGGRIKKTVDARR